MSLIDAVQRLVSSRATEDAGHRKSADRCMAEIAIRELTHQTRPIDPDDLLELLEETGTTLEDYQAIVGAASRIRHLQARLENAQKLAVDRVKYRAKLKQQQRIAERMIAEAQTEYAKRDQAASSIIGIKDELERHKKNHPFLFDGDEPISAINAIELPPERKLIAPTRTCDFCGANFNSDDPKEKFCSHLCRKDAVYL